MQAKDILDVISSFFDSHILIQISKQLRQRERFHLAVLLRLNYCYFQLMFVVQTEQSSERTMLQQDYPAVNRHFYVASKEVSSLVGVVRSILFEYFRGSPPLLAQKITELVMDSLNMTLSLTLLREILSLVRTYSESVHLFKLYFSEESLVFGSENTLFDTIEEQLSHIEENSVLEESIRSKDIYTAEFQEILQKEINQRATVKTKNTGSKQEGETILEGLQKRQRLQLSLNKVLSYHMPTQDGHWWRHEDTKERLPQGNDSQSIVEFQRKGEPLMRQDSINEVVRRQAETDSNIESEYFIRDDRYREFNRIKFSKRMKDRLVSARMKKKRKRHQI